VIATLYPPEVENHLTTNTNHNSRAMSEDI